MTDQDPRYQETVRTTVKDTDPLRPGAPTHIESVETQVRGRETSNTGWWVAGLIAVAAIVAVTWMVLSATAQGPDAEAQAVEQAIDDARRQGQLEGAQDGLEAASAARTDAAIAAAERAAASAAAARAEAEAARARPDAVVVQPEPQVEPDPAESDPPPVQ